MSRSRDESIDEALFESARQLVAVGGLRAVSMSSISKGAGVPRSTLLRRFARPEEVLVQACRRSLEEVYPRSDSPPGRVQVQAMLSAVCGLLRRPGFAAVVRVIAAEMGHSQAMAEELKGPLVARRRLLLAQLVAYEHRERLVDALLGGIYLPFLFENRVLSELEVHNLVEAIL